MQQQYQQLQDIETPTENDVLMGRGGKNNQASECIVSNLSAITILPVVVTTLHKVCAQLDFSFHPVDRQREVAADCPHTSGRVRHSIQTRQVPYIQGNGRGHASLVAAGTVLAKMPQLKMGRRRR